MKIIYLHQYFHTPEMAGSTRSYETARRLVKDGNEVHMITSDQTLNCNKKYRLEIIEGIKVHWIKNAYNNKFSYEKRIISFLKFIFKSTYTSLNIDCDIIFATSTPLTIAIPALILAFIKRKPFIFEVRDMWPDLPIATGAISNKFIIFCVKKLELITYKRASHIIALAPGMRKDIIRKGINKNKVSVIPNACDLDIFQRSEKIKLRDDIDWLRDRKLIIYAGALGFLNNVIDLAKVAIEINKIDPEIRILVIGDGKDKKFIKQYAIEKKIYNKNFFMIDAMSKKDLAKWLAVSNLQIALFKGPKVLWKDAVQNKFFDSIASGKPIACNFNGWQTKIAIKNEIGFYINTENPKSAAKTIINYLDDFDWLNNVEEKAKNLAENEFNRDKLVKKLSQILKKV